MTNPKAKENLHSKLAEVMAEVGTVPKRGENKQQGYKYVTESDLADAVRERLSSRGVMFFTSIVSSELTPVQSKQGGSGFLAEIVTRHEFVDAETGESYAFEMVGAGIDFPGDKSVYKALTGAVKYALMKTFLIATGDDPEQDESQPTKRSTSRSPKSAPKEPPRGTATEAQIRKLGILASERGLTKRDARLAAAAVALGVEVVESFNSLSKGQASALIEMWSSTEAEGVSESAPPISPTSVDAGKGGTAPPPRPDDGQPATEEQWKRAARLYGSRGSVVSAAHREFKTAKADDVTRGQLASLIEAKLK